MRKILAMLCIFLIVNMILLTNCLAADSDTDLLRTPEEIEEIYNFRRTNQIAPSNYIINSFDISESGNIAIVFREILGTNYAVNVFNNNMDFQYAIELRSNGDCGVSYSADNLQLYFVRSDYLCTLDNSGEISAVQVLDNHATETSHFLHNLFKDDRIMDSKKYRVKLGCVLCFFVGGSKLVVEENGTEKVLIDHSKEVKKDISLFMLGVVIFASFIFLLLYKYGGYDTSKITLKALFEKIKEVIKNF